MNKAIWLLMLVVVFSGDSQQRNIESNSHQQTNASTLSTYASTQSSEVDTNTELL